MRENSRRGAPRSARGSGRAAGRDGRARGTGARGSVARGSGSRGAGPISAGAGGDGGRPGPGNRGAAPGSAEAERLSAMIEPIVAAMNMDLEAVKIGAAGRRRVLRVIIDADGGVSLDDIAVVSRELSAWLDARNAMGDAPYTLEVSSPGIDRPLTQPRHWRRAVGRLVAVTLAGKAQDQERDAGAGSALAHARVISADRSGVTLEIDGSKRTFGYTELGPGRVQVEFGRLDEIEDSDQEIDGSDDAGAGDGADEEDRNGH
jgi:ribosome maturation factor RimP